MFKRIICKLFHSKYKRKVYRFTDKVSGKRVNRCTCSKCNITWLTDGITRLDI